MEGCLNLLRAWIWLLLAPSLAWGDAANNEWNSTTRSLSMGNVGIASAEDAATAMFYNPAALARGKRASVEIFNPQFDSGSSIFSGAGVSKHISLKDVKPELERKPNRGSYLGGSLYPNVSAQNFNFGILMKGEGGSYYDGTNLHYVSRYLVIPTMGLSMGTFGGRFRLGAAVRGIQYSGNDETVKGLHGGEGYTVDMREGVGLGLDAGALITMPWKALPTFGFVARNVGDTSFPGGAAFSFNAGDSRPREKIKMTYDAGFSLAPKVGQRSVLSLAVDYRDALNVNDINVKRRINLGVELGMSRTVYVRLGVSRGYWTAGMGLASKHGSLDLGTYAEELNARGFRVVEDRRFSFRYGSRF